MGACTSAIELQDGGAGQTRFASNLAPSKQPQPTQPQPQGAAIAIASASHSSKRRSRRSSRSHTRGVAPAQPDELATATEAAMGPTTVLDSAQCIATAADQSAASTHTATPAEPAEADSDRRVPLSAVSTSLDCDSGVAPFYSARHGRHSTNLSAQLLPLDQLAAASLHVSQPISSGDTVQPPMPQPPCAHLPYAVAVAPTSANAVPIPSVTTPAMAAWGARASDSRPASASTRQPPAPQSRPSSARTKPFGRAAAGVADGEHDAGFSMQDPHIAVEAEMPPSARTPSAAVSVAGGAPAPPTTDCLKLVRRMEIAKLPSLRMPQEDRSVTSGHAGSSRVSARSRKQTSSLRSLPCSLGSVPCGAAEPNGRASSPPLVSSSVFVDGSCQAISSKSSGRSRSNLPLIVAIDCRTPPEPTDPAGCAVAAAPSAVAFASSPPTEEAAEKVKLVRRVRGGAKWRKQVEQVKQKQLEEELAATVGTTQQHHVHVHVAEHKEQTPPKPSASIPVNSVALAAGGSTSVPQGAAPQPVRPLDPKPARSSAAPQRLGTPTPSHGLSSFAPPAPPSLAQPQQPKPISVTPRDLLQRPVQRQLEQRGAPVLLGHPQPVRSTAHASSFHMPPPHPALQAQAQQQSHSQPHWMRQPLLPQHTRAVPCPFPSRSASPPGRSLLDFQEELAQTNRAHVAAMGVQPRGVLELMRAGMLAPRVAEKLVRAGTLLPLHTSRGGLSRAQAIDRSRPYIYDRSGNSLPELDLADELGPAPIQLVAKPAQPLRSQQPVVAQPRAPFAPATISQASIVRPLSAVQKLKMSQRSSGTFAAPLVRNLPLMASTRPRPTIPPLNLELLGLPRSRPESSRHPVLTTRHGRLFPLTPRGAKASISSRAGAGSEDEYEPGSRRTAPASSPSSSPVPAPRAPAEAVGSRLTLDGALDTSRRPASSRPKAASGRKKAVEPLVPRTLPAPAQPQVPLKQQQAAVAPAVAVAAPVAPVAQQAVSAANPTMTRTPAPGHFAQDLSKDAASIRSFCAKVSAAASQGRGGIAHLTLFQSAPSANPVSVVESHVWRILDAVIAGAAARAPGAACDNGPPRVLDVLDMTDVTGEGMVRSIMRRMCQAEPENELQEQKQQQQQHAQASNGGLLQLKQLLVRLNFPSMCEPRFSQARNIYSLCLRALSSTSLTHLNLYKSALGEKGVSTVIAAAARNPNLRTLEMVACGVGPLGGQMLVLLAEHPSLTAVDLSLNCMGDAEILTACAALGHRNSKLQSLGLALNEFGIEGVRALSRTIRSRGSHPCGLRSLNIEGNNLSGRQGGMEIAAMLLSASCALERLNVSYANLGVEGVRAVCEAMPRNTILRELNVAGNMGPDLSRSAANSSAAAVAAAQVVALRCLELLSLNLTLRAIDLRDNHMLARPSALVQSLSNFVAAHPRIESVLVSGNGLTREQAAALQALLAHRKEQRGQPQPQSLQRKPTLERQQSKQALLVPHAPVAARPSGASSHGIPKLAVAPAAERQPLASLPAQQSAKLTALTAAAAKLTARISARTTLVSNLGAPRVTARVYAPSAQQQALAPAQPLARAHQQPHPPGGMQVFYASLDGGRPAPAGGRPISARPLRSSSSLSGAGFAPSPHKLPSARSDLMVFGVSPPQIHRLSHPSSAYLVDPNNSLSLGCGVSAASNKQATSLNSASSSWNLLAV